MTSPGYVALLIGHVLAAIVGIGSIGATSYFCSQIRRIADPLENEAIRRYFRAGRNLAGLGVYAIPVFGAALLSTSTSDEVAKLYPWIGLGCWVGIVALATSTIWPCEAALRRLFTSGGDLEAARGLARRAEWAAAAASLLGVVALITMFAQP